MLLWEEMKTEQIIGGVTSDGVRYLKLFLKDYSNLTNTTNLCASCNNLIADYHKKYKIKMQEKDNTCQFRLLEKYNGVQLELGSSVFVNNGNITDEFGFKLLETKGARLFAKMPEPIVETITDAPKQKSTRKSKKQ